MPTSAPAPLFVPFPFALAEAQEPKEPVPGPSPGTQTPETQQPGGAVPPKQQPPVGCMDSGTIWMLLPFLLLMWLLVMRPEQKRRKEQQALLASLKVGDRVVTTGGLHGVVAALTDRTVTLHVDDTRMTFDRAAVGRIERNDTGTAQEPKKG